MAGKVSRRSGRPVAGERAAIHICGRLPIHPDTLTNWFSDFIKRHDLPKVTLHGLRHTNASLLIAAGTNIRTVSGRLGHSQASTTANIYAHAIQSADAIAAEALGNILSPTTPANTK